MIAPARAARKTFVLRRNRAFRRANTARARDHEVVKAAHEKAQFRTIACHATAG
jgi:hypothetical protein